MLCILRMGGLTTGGVNFDAKVRRESFEPVDLFHAHIGGMDAFARGLKIARAIMADGRLAAFVKERYRSWDCELGRRVEAGKAKFEDLEAYILPKGRRGQESNVKRAAQRNVCVVEKSLISDRSLFDCKHCSSSAAKMPCMKAGRSSGVRLVTMLPSRTQAASCQMPPAFSTSSRIAKKPVVFFAFQAFGRAEHPGAVADRGQDLAQLGCLGDEVDHRRVPAHVVGE